MHFSLVSVENLGRFVKVDFRFSRFTLLVGPNDSGKTTAIRALEMVSGQRTPTVEDFRRDDNAAGGRASPIAIKVVIENAPEALAKELGLLDGDKPTFRFTWDLVNVEGEVRVARTAFSVQRRIPGRAELQTWPPLAEQQRAMLNAMGIVPAANASERKAQWESARSEAMNDPGKTVLGWVDGGRDLFLKFAPRVESIAPGDLEDPGILLEKLVVQRVRDIVYPADEEGQRHLPEALRVLEEDATEKLNFALEELVTLMKRHLPGLTRIKIEPQWDLVSGSKFSEVKVEQGGVLLPMAELGGGSSARSSLAILEWGAAAGLGAGHRVRTMDEPDHHLHFDAQRRLVALLRKDVVDPTRALGQCIVATHSLVMVDATPLDEVVYLPFNLAPGASLAPMLSRSEAEAGDMLGNILAGLGLPASWAYLEKALIIVEGSSDRSYVRELYHRTVGHTMVEDGVRIWDAEGCGNVGSAVKRLEEKGRARVFVALDSDAKLHPAPANSTVDTLGQFLGDVLGPSAPPNRIVWLGSKEVEDAWHPISLAAIAQENWPKSDGTPWAPSDFEAYKTAEKPSHELEVVIRRGCGPNLQRRRMPTKERIATLYGRLPAEVHPPDLVAMLRAVSDHCHRE